MQRIKKSNATNRVQGHPQCWLSFREFGFWAVDIASAERGGELSTHTVPMLGVPRGYRGPRSAHCMPVQSCWCQQPLGNQKVRSYPRWTSNTWSLGSLNNGWAFQNEVLQVKRWELNLQRIKEDIKDKRHRHHYCAEFPSSNAIWDGSHGFAPTSELMSLEQGRAR